MISAVNDLLDDLRGGRMSESPLVTVEQGQLQGRIVNSPSGKAFYSFQGIPYAKPPLGSLRFKAPQPAEPWEGVRDATTEGNVSPQIDPSLAKTYTGDENCLYLNVYTPHIAGNLPVMIWIHGGGFKWGSGNETLYGADFLVEKDVVVVTINYRCGALGFLCLNTPEVPGNAGLKDVVQALRWVKQNVKNFGGDPDNLTVFGESVGGAVTTILTASPLTKNLISKAIVQSGTGLSKWSQQRDPLLYAKTLANHLGSDADNVDDILEFLTTVTARELVEATESLNPFNQLVDDLTNYFAVVVEKEFPGVEAVLTEPLLDILTSGRTADIPIIIGETKNEFPNSTQNDDLQKYIPSELNLERDSQESLAIAEKIRTLYFTSEEQKRDNFEKLANDYLLKIDINRYVKHLVQTSNQPIYFYQFDYVGQFNIAHKSFLNEELKYAWHMDELGYLFKNDFQKDVDDPSQQDIKTRETMVRLWTNFAKFGNPTPDEDDYLTTKWLPVTIDTLFYLNLGEEVTLQKNLNEETMSFWQEVYSKHFKIWDHPKSNTIEAPRKLDNSEEGIHPTSELVGEIYEEAVPYVTSVVEDTQVEQPTAEPVAEKVYEEAIPYVAPVNGETKLNGDVKPRISNEIKMAQTSAPKDVVRAMDPPEDDLPKNIGVIKFVNFYESLGGKK